MINGMLCSPGKRNCEMTSQFVVFKACIPWPWIAAKTMDWTTMPHDRIKGNVSAGCRFLIQN